MLDKSFKINYFFVVSAVSNYTNCREEFSYPLKALYTSSDELDFFVFPFTKIFTFYLLWWFILMCLLRSKTIFIISLCLSNEWILKQSLLHAFADTYTVSVDCPLQHILLKLSTIHNHPIFGVMFLLPLLILQRILKSPNFCFEYFSLFWLI